MNDATMRTRLAGARIGRLASVRTDGSPHVVPCCFVLDGETVYSAVDAKPKSTARLQRIRNLETNAAAALAVDHYDDEDWTALWWVRVDGTARVLDAGDEFASALDLLTTKYHQYRELRPQGPVIALDVARWTAWP